jgi:hypothetical protein
MAGKEALTRANKAKQDEFYTQLPDVEDELRHYHTQFRDKVVFCNCDDPYESAFFKYFAMNFNHLRLKKLLTTSYAGSPISGQQLPLFHPDEEPKPAYQVEITEVSDLNADGAIDLLDVEQLLKSNGSVVTRLKGDGDFRSPESVALLEASDIVVTNPPFSLFRDYVGQLLGRGKQFLILGNLNAITYKEIYPLIKGGQIWLGHQTGGEKWFRVPSSYVHTTDKSKIKVEDGVRYLAMKNMAWFTNLDTTKRHETLTLYKRYAPEEYPRYDNCNAIEVGTYMDIPLDYEGVMGVPITFLDKYNPDQFEILRFRKGDDGKDLSINGKSLYFRVLIRARS